MLPHLKRSLSAFTWRQYHNCCFHHSSDGVKMRHNLAFGFYTTKSCFEKLRHPPGLLNNLHLNNSSVAHSSFPSFPSSLAPSPICYCFHSIPLPHLPIHHWHGSVPSASQWRGWGATILRRLGGCQEQHRVQHYVSAPQGSCVIGLRRGRQIRQAANGP